MKRDQFLRLSVFAVVAAGFPLQSCKSSIDEQGLSHPTFLARLFDAHTINETGKAYLEKVPEENDRYQLIQLLAKDDAIANAKDDRSINEYLDKTIQQDFESGNTMRIILIIEQLI
jgi:hypothetical protein